VSVAEYGDLTPRELLLIVDEYNSRTQREREESLTMAYMAAYLQRAKRMPSLQKLLEDCKPKQPQTLQTPEQILAAVKQLQAKLSREEG